MCFCPEYQTGNLYTYTVYELQNAAQQKTIISARAIVFDSNRCLHFDLGAMQGIMPFEECAYGISEGYVKDIAVITRVGRVCHFIITEIAHDENGTPYCILSRTAAQKRCAHEYLNKLCPGDIIPCTVTSIESFGAFCDVGCGISALLPIDCMSVSRIQSPRDRVCPEQSIFCVVRSRDSHGRLVLSMKELLGTWQQNADNFTAGETVLGTVRGIEEYGVFVELAPNLAGLAEYSESVEIGDTVSVYIKSILPEKMKIKLIILSVQTATAMPHAPQYTQTNGRIESFVYSPEGCKKIIRTDFA